VGLSITRFSDDSIPSALPISRSLRASIRMSQYVAPNKRQGPFGSAAVQLKRFHFTFARFLQAIICESWILGEVMEILKTQSAVAEICAENVKRLRFAPESGRSLGAPCSRTQPGADVLIARFWNTVQQRAHRGSTRLKE